VERLTVKEAAEHLGISEDGVRKRIARGKLDSVKVDGTVYVFAEDLADETPDLRKDRPSSTRRTDVDRLNTMVLELLQTQIRDQKQRIAFLEKQITETMDLLRAEAVQRQHLMNEINRMRGLRPASKDEKPYRVHKVYQADRSPDEIPEQPPARVTLSNYW
jgi:excisionase family DNA binding protein